MQKKVWGTALILVVIACVAVIIARLQKKPAFIEGATLLQDTDPRRQVPIPNVEVTATAGGRVVQGKSDASGFFHLTLPGTTWRRETADLQFRHPGYKPLNLTQQLGDELGVVRMAAVGSSTAENATQTTIRDVRVRYATKATMPINVGSAARTFEVVNTGNVPCQRVEPCSPDGHWKAAIGGLTLDAGEGHDFQNVRVSCIAGPCPFTKIESDQFSRGGRVIKVAVRNWSDTVTFLLEAEVIQTMLSDIVRNSYPAIFGREMSFTLPPLAQGPSIDAEMNGTEIVYPLGPALTLSWADCELQIEADRTKLYRCELRPGYRFQ